MKSFVFAVAIFLLFGCGVAPVLSGPSGLFADSSYDEEKRTIFYEVKEEFKWTEGEFDELLVIIMPPVFQCETHRRSCSSEYTGGNIIKLGNPYVFDYEVAKYLWFRNNGMLPPPAHDATRGIFIDSTTEIWLAATFLEVKECGVFKDGEYESLSIAFSATSFPCKYYNGACSGKYTSPNKIRVGRPGAWKHEVLHYLLDVNSGAPDEHHKSRLFKECT